MMQWDRLICDTRFGLEELNGDERHSDGTRTEFRRDYDRLVFSSPFRRLQNKTQVFPLPGSIFVHNRLTHSLEVSSVGRSMAADVATELRRRHAGEPWVDRLESLSEIVAAACLAHDLGNPPFGHSGERAISSYFSEGAGAWLKGRLDAAQWADLTHFDGNANAFRLLTHRFNGRRPGGFAMTYSTLASIVKYPYDAGLAGDRNKFGFFTTERDAFARIAGTLGLLPLATTEGHTRYARHPLVYLVETADDICYEIMDIEDAHKLGILPHDKVVELLLGFFEPERQERQRRTMAHVEDPNEQVCYLRSSVIGLMVRDCVRAFVDGEEAILSGTFQGGLLAHASDRVRHAYAECNAVSWDKIYRAHDVVSIELAGNRIITSLLDSLVNAALRPDLYYSQLLLSQVPAQYQMDSPDTYGRIQAAIDHITGMTDVYALDLYRRLNGMSLKIEN